jgi:cytochrome o ubiquinol oxidase subunit 2
MNPSGDIANQQARLIVISTALMLLIIVPVIILTLLFAWRYRKSNTSAPTSRTGITRPAWNWSSGAHPC